MLIGGDAGEDMLDEIEHVARRVAPRVHASQTPGVQVNRGRMVRVVKHPYVVHNDVSVAQSGAGSEHATGSERIAR